MGKFFRDRLPPPIYYYTYIAGFKLVGSGKWLTGPCDNHGGSDSMRFNRETGAYVCMAGCGARGGDVLSHYCGMTGLSFVEGAKALGAYVDDGKPYDGPTRPAQPSGRSLLQLAGDDLYLCADVVSAVCVALDKYPQIKEALDGRLTKDDFDTFMQAAGRVIHVAGVANV